MCSTERRAGDITQHQTHTVVRQKPGWYLCLHLSSLPPSLTRSLLPPSLLCIKKTACIALQVRAERCAATHRFHFHLHSFSAVTSQRSWRRSSGTSRGVLSLPPHLILLTLFLHLGIAAGREGGRREHARPGPVSRRRPYFTPQKYYKIDKQAGANPWDEISSGGVSGRMEG